MEFFVQLFLIVTSLWLLDAFWFLGDFGEQEFEVVLSLFKVNEYIFVLSLAFLDIAKWLKNTSKAWKTQVIKIFMLDISGILAERYLVHSCFGAIDHVAIACFVGIIWVVATSWETAYLRTELLCNLLGICVLNLMHLKKLN